MIWIVVGFLIGCVVVGFFECRKAERLEKQKYEMRKIMYNCMRGKYE